MNKLVAPFAALAFVFSGAIAHADETAGKVAAVDSSTLILEDGTTFTIGEGNIGVSPRARDLFHRRRQVRRPLRHFDQIKSGVH